MRSIQVIIPTYNSELFIAETLDSVLAQQVEQLEILVLDNCSTDGTPARVAEFQKHGVRYVRNETNIGAINNHNRAIELATGDYIKLLSSDDVLIPGVLAIQAAALDRLPPVAVVTCNCTVTDGSLNALHDETYLPAFQNGRAAVAHCARRVANLLGAPSNTLLRRRMIGPARLDPALKWMGRSRFPVSDIAGRRLLQHRSDRFLLSSPWHDGFDAELP